MSDAEELWRGRSDDQLVKAAQLLDEYTVEGQRVIQAELLRRGLVAAPLPILDSGTGVSPLSNLASLGDRLLGQMLDAMVAIGPLAVVIPLDNGDPVGRIAFLITLLFAVFYLLFSDGFENGQSYGKRIVKTAVVDATTGRPCSFRQSFVRNLLLSILGVIDWVFIFGKRRQRLGDKAAHTVVVYGPRQADRQAFSSI
jgi:uncharacterized RDD family membrane protein YckC